MKESTQKILQWKNRSRLFRVLHVRQYKKTKQALAKKDGEGKKSPEPFLSASKKNAQNRLHEFEKVEGADPQTLKVLREIADEIPTDNSVPVTELRDRAWARVRLLANADPAILALHESIAMLLDHECQAATNDSSRRTSEKPLY